MTAGPVAADATPEPTRDPLPDGDVVAEHRDYALCSECDGPISLDEAEGNGGVHHGCDLDADQ